MFLLLWGTSRILNGLCNFLFSRLWIFTVSLNVSDFTGSSFFLSGSRTMFAAGLLLQTGAALLLLFLPLFAQRLIAIIGVTTRHYSYLSTHTRVQKTNVCACVWGGVCCKHTITSSGCSVLMMMFSLRFCQVVQGLSQLAAALKGATLQGNSRRINRWATLPL